MDIKSFYEVTGGDYNDVLGRLMNDALIQKFVVKFKSDSSFSNLEAAMQAEDVDAAFNSAHTLKGVAANMGFKMLYEATSELVEQLRPRNEQPDNNLFEKVKDVYKLIVDKIDELD